jgi:PAS domain S-box-containing protein
MLNSRRTGDNGAAAVLLLSGEGTVLARSGPESMLGAPRQRIGYADLPTYFRGESGEDLLGLVRDVADGAGPLVVRVLSERWSPEASILLTLHAVAPGLVVGVVSEGQSVAFGVDYAVGALRMVWDGLAEGIAIAIPGEPKQTLEIIAANGAFASTFGLGSDDVEGCSFGQLLAPLNADTFDQRVRQEVLAEGKSISDLTLSQQASGERTLLDWELGPVRGRDGRTLGAIAVVRGNIRAQRAPRRLRADLDPTSGLPNQVHFLRRLERSIDRAAQPRAYSFAVIGLEMRGLRAVERRLGTLVANTALEALVRRLEQRLRPTDLVARTGDRRLAVLLDHFAPWGELDDVLDRIRRVTDAPYTIAGERMTMSAIGAPGPLWSGDEAGVGAQDVLQLLDVAVTRAMAGRTHPRRRANVEEGNADLGELSRAIAQEQLTLRYLPLVSLEDGRIAGWEALVGWSRPDHRVVPSRDFIVEAERHGLITTIGQWVWTEALRHIREWDETLRGGRVPPIHLNVSLSEFWTPGLALELERRAAASAVEPSRIRIEIPELAVARRASAAHDILAELAAAGFEPWLDRFGEGGTQLRALDSLPFRYAKLIPSLAWGTNGSAGQPRAVLGSLLAFGHDLGWRVAVAGVETRVQAAALEDAGCDMAQGFFYHGLLDASQAAAVMRRSRDDEAPGTSETPHPA